MFGEVDAWNELITLRVTTWYIHHVNYVTWRQPRVVTLTSEVITWIDDLRTVWAAELDLTVPFSIKIVTPRPPGLRRNGHSLHLIIEQQLPEFRAAIVATALLEGFGEEGFVQGAFSTPSTLDLHTLIDILEVGPFCAD